MLTAILDKGLSARTAKYAHAVLRRALGQAQRWGMVTRNVATLVEPPKAVRPEVRALAPHEVHALLDAAKGDRFEAILTVAIAVGLRRGEALGLRWSDIDLDAAVVRVRRALVFVDGDLRFVDPKTKRSRRTIPLPSVSVQALREHRRRQAAKRLVAGPDWTDQDLVFQSATGGPMDPNNLGRHFRALCDRAGIGRVRLHDLRHTCASLLLAQNVHPRVVMEILGHSGIAITRDTYSHVLPELQREAADRMDQALGYTTNHDEEDQDPPEPEFGVDGA
jgi:integrase